MPGPVVRVAHLVSHPIQYFAPLYRELARRPDIDLTVYFYSDATLREFYDPGFGRAVRWDLPLVEGYRTRICRSAATGEIPSGFFGRPHGDIVREVGFGRYDVVWAHGYAHLTTWLVFAAARARGAGLLIRDEQTLLHGRPWYTRAAKAVLLRALLSQAWGLYIGEQNRRYLERYGVPPARLVAARYCVDNRVLQQRALELRAQRPALRAGFGITDDAPVVLFCGKLVEKKQPLLLLEAFERVQRRQRCWLLIAGDGPLRPAAEDLVARRRIPRVRMPGFLNQTELPAAYTAADLFVLPSARHETWGLVVNEAMNFALPIIVSDTVGCAEDLVRPHWNGVVVSHRDVDALADAIATLVADPEQRRAFGARSLKLVGEYSVEACADGIVAACLAAGQGRAARRRGGRA